jgi:REP element-mobilizing transposase RayT
MIHVVFSTKDRYPFLTPVVRPELHSYMATIFQTCESPAVVINSMADHVDVLCNLSRRRAIGDVVEDVKKDSSKWLKTKGGMLQKFYWQGGYGAFSVSPSNVASVPRYIERQEEHHQKISFQDEFRELLRKHGIEFDERYLWE